MRLIDLSRRAFLLPPGISRALARLLAPGPVYHLLMLAAFLAVFALIPLTLYLHSGEDWRFRPILLAELAAIGFALYLIAAVSARLLAAAYPRAAAVVAVALFCVGTFALVGHVYAPVQIGPLDGSELVSPESLSYTLVEIGIAAVLAVVFLQLVRRRGLLPAAWFAGLVIVVTLGYFAAAVLESGAAEPSAKATTKPSGHVDRNVYHFVLDTFQTDAFLALLKRQPELAERLQGFQLFENNISNYMTTRPSAASYFTGTLYANGPFKKWLWSWRQRGLLKQLHAYGYQISMYAPFSNWDNKLISRYHDQYDAYEEQFGFAGTAFYDFLHMWLVSLVPNGLTNEAIEPAGALRDQLFRAVVGRNPPLSISDGMQAYGSVLMLRRLAREEARRPRTGQYVYAHATLPHGPFVMNADCSLVGRPESGRADEAARKRAYLEQAACAVRLLTEFLDQLNELGRYNEATIVVHADTGHGIGFINDPRPARSGPRTLGHPDVALLSSINALLMVKPPHANGALAVRDTPTQLIDLFPTLVDLLELEPPRYKLAGRSVFKPAHDERRVAQFGFDPKRKHGPDIVHVQIDDPTDIANAKLTVLGPPEDPANWREEIRRAAGEQPSGPSR